MASYEPKTANGGSYDQRLLASAPSVTRAEKQEGYNVDLLEEGRRPASPPSESPISEPHAPRASQPSLHREREPAPLPIAARRLPWYRRPAGIIGIVAVILVIIGAVVGGAVGGTRHHSNNNNAASPSSSSADNGQQTLGSGPGGGSQATAIESTTTTGGGSLGTGEAEVQLGPKATPTPSAQLSAVGSLGEGP